MPTDLHHVDFDPEFREGARNAVRVCLQVAPLERAVLITDRVSLGIGAALAEQFLEAGADLATFVLEDLAPRPLKGLPAVVLDALEHATVSCFAAVGQEGELHSQIEMTGVVNRRRIRHAHMVNISPRIMVEGMRADFRKVDALCRWLLPRMEATKVFRAVSAAGSDLTATFDPRIKWHKTSGIISPDKWGNLPGGEVSPLPTAWTTKLTCPACQQALRIRASHAGRNVNCPNCHLALQVAEDLSGLVGQRQDESTVVANSAGTATQGGNRRSTTPPPRPAAIPRVRLRILRGCRPGRKARTP